LTSLNLSDCSFLILLNCRWNCVTNLILPNKPTSLKKMYLDNNNFEQDLSFLQESVNLEELDLGNNKFEGSLEPLKDMNKLKELNINDNDINSGLEYLPVNLEKFSCSTYKRKDAKCKTLKEQLAFHDNNLQT